MVINSTAVPDLIGGLVVDIGKVTVGKKELLYSDLNDVLYSLEEVRVEGYLFLLFVPMVQQFYYLYSRFNSFIRILLLGLCIGIFVEVSMISVSQQP